MSQDLNIRHLEYFLKVAQLGSINKAAQALFISQPYLGKIVHDLEEQGDRLFLASMRKLHKNCTDLIEVIAWREVYHYLESCMDACEHVADTVERVVMNNT